MGPPVALNINKFVVIILIRVQNGNIFVKKKMKYKYVRNINKILIILNVNNIHLNVNKII